MSTHEIHMLDTLKESRWILHTQEPQFDPSHGHSACTLDLKPNRPFVYTLKLKWRRTKMFPSA